MNGATRVRVAWTAAVVLGAVVGGVFGAVVVLAALRAARRFGIEALWRAAVALMVLAALATVFEGRPAAIDADYATRRPLANALAMASLLITTIAIAKAALTERKARS